MRVLGIETSCDETAISLIDVCKDSAVNILFEAVSSQIDLHARYGGVVPELASREHLKNLPFLLNDCLVQSSITLESVDKIAVTRGPGLKGCLLMGLEFAKGLVLACEPPLGGVGVNHIEGHIVSACIQDTLPKPSLVLVVSGGHTELLIYEGFGAYRCIARTIDDAAGEAFDKSAALLGFPYPGGAALAKCADRVDASSFELPVVMKEAEGFSFSGLKTAVSLLLQKVWDGQDESLRAELCFAVQEAIVESIMLKVKRAVHRTGIRSIAVVGGVAANRALRESLSRVSELEVTFAPLKYCTDNATMIALAGAYSEVWTLDRFLSCDVRARWPVEEIHAS